MNIKEAAEQAAKLGLGMRRRNDEWPPGLIVFPTDTVDCCVLELETEGKKSRRRGWEPYADDLIAEDWELAEKLDGFPESLGRNAEDPTGQRGVPDGGQLDGDGISETVSEADTDMAFGRQGAGGVGEFALGGAGGDL